MGEVKISVTGNLVKRLSKYLSVRFRPCVSCLISRC